MKKICTVTPFPGLRIRCGELDEGEYTVEVWREVQPDVWAYTCIMPPQLADRYFEDHEIYSEDAK